MPLNFEKLRPHTLSYGTSNTIVRYKTREVDKEGLILALIRHSDNRYIAQFRYL